MHTHTHTHKHAYKRGQVLAMRKETHNAAFIYCKSHVLLCIGMMKNYQERVHLSDCVFLLILWVAGLITKNFSALRHPVKILTTGRCRCFQLFNLCAYIPHLLRVVSFSRIISLFCCSPVVRYGFWVGYFRVAL